MKIYKSIKCIECGDRRLKNITIKEDRPFKVYQCLHCNCEFIKNLKKREGENHEKK